MFNLNIIIIINMHAHFAENYLIRVLFSIWFVYFGIQLSKQYTVGPMRVFSLFGNNFGEVVILPLPYFALNTLFDWTETMNFAIE